MKNWFELFAFCDFMLKFILRKMNKKKRLAIGIHVYYDGTESRTIE